jgi:hypothetical protein
VDATQERFMKEKANQHKAKQGQQHERNETEGEGNFL